MLVDTGGPTDVASYEYDGLGRRIMFIDHVNTSTKCYIYDNQRVIEEYDASENRQRYYIWGNYIDELLLLNDDAGDDSDYFICHNHLFSPEALVDSSGAITERYDYDAYGKVTIFTEDGGDSDWWDGDETYTAANLIGLPYFFTGRELDSLDSGNLKLYNYRARTYHPELNRFLQRDPFGYIDSMNLYEYVTSNPIIGLDPTGKFFGILERVRETVANINIYYTTLDAALSGVGDPAELLDVAIVMNQLKEILFDDDPFAALDRYSNFWKGLKLPSVSCNGGKIMECLAWEIGSAAVVSIVEQLTPLGNLGWAACGACVASPEPISKVIGCVGCGVYLGYKGYSMVRTLSGVIKCFTENCHFN